MEEESVTVNDCDDKDNTDEEEYPTTWKAVLIGALTHGLSEAIKFAGAKISECVDD